MVKESITEVIFVGLPGPTHHYGGLSCDNVAAVTNKGSTSNPKQAALQALDLVRLLATLGVPAAILPPQLRPHMGLLRGHFAGSDDEVIAQAAQHAPELLEKASSASAMWTANAATVAPSVDCADHRLHLTVANLYTNLHRRIEAEATYHVLQAIFNGVPNCEVHPPLVHTLRDEGAANHMRLSPQHADKGLHVFVYGDSDGRQDLAASQAVAAQHRIPEAQALFIKQNPEVIRCGVFHNDVIAVSNEYVLLAHELAYAGGRADIERIAQAYEALACSPPVSPPQAGGILSTTPPVYGGVGGNPFPKQLCAIIVAEAELSVEEAVHTYVFNSQIVTKPDGKMAVIAPAEAALGNARRLLERIAADGDNPIDEIHTVDLRQSMRNGGGPACLRLRVPMTEAQLSAVKNSVNVFADETLLAAITKIIEKYYPDELSARDLGNPELYHQCKAMLEELGRVMGYNLRHCERME